MNNYSIESYFTICHSAGFFFTLINFEKANIYQSKKKSTKYSTDIDYKEENKSVQIAKEVCCSISYTSGVSLG